LCVDPGLPLSLEFVRVQRGDEIPDASAARRIPVGKKEIRRMLDLRHPAKLPRIQPALDALGVRLALSMEEAA